MFQVERCELVAPTLLERRTHLGREWPSIRNHACCHNAVSGQQGKCSRQHLDILAPSCFLSTQAANELVSSCELQLTQVHVILQLRLLGHRCIKVCFKSSNLVLHRAQGFLCLGQLLLAISELSFCFSQQLSLWLHSLGHKVVAVHRTYPQAYSLARNRCLLDSRWVKVLALDVGRDSLNGAVRNVVPVEIEEPVQQLLGVVQHLLLRCLPPVINLLAWRVGVILLHWFQLEHYTDRLTSQTHA
mmetsp:Transcript_18948/g.44232  ORF Transcript_18948/g.44232 Transcript_18948/m.44232 type:complete len:244 (-) Transcript_18948:3978-4709(-)